MRIINKTIRLLVWMLLKLVRAQAVTFRFASGDCDTFELPTEKCPKWMNHGFIIWSAHNTDYKGGNY